MPLSWATFIYPEALSDIINAWLICENLDFLCPFKAFFHLYHRSVDVLWQISICFQHGLKRSSVCLFFTQKEHCNFRLSTLILKPCRSRGMPARTLGQIWLSSTSKCLQEGNVLPCVQIFLPLRPQPVPGHEGVRDQNARVWMCLFCLGSSPCHSCSHRSPSLLTKWWPSHTQNYLDSYQDTQKVFVHPGPFAMSQQIPSKGALFPWNVLCGHGKR